MTGERKARERGGRIWAAGLVGLFLLFAGANAVLVTLALRGDRDLVRGDYYEAALNHDAEIAARRRADSLGMIWQVAGGTGGWRLILEFPRGTGPVARASEDSIPIGTPRENGLPESPGRGPGKELFGEPFPAGGKASLRFYRPSDGALDLQMDLGRPHFDPHLPGWVFEGPGAALEPGLWEVHANLQPEGAGRMHKAIPLYIGG